MSHAGGVVKRGRAVVCGGRRRTGARSGAILLEVLLAVSLLGVVTSCLLSMFHQARQVERLMSEDLEKIEADGRLFQMLRDDLIEARAIVREEGEGRARGLLLLLPNRRDGSVYHSGTPWVGCRWDFVDGELLRTEEGTERESAPVVIRSGASLFLLFYDDEGDQLGRALVLGGRSPGRAASDAGMPGGEARQHGSAGGPPAGTAVSSVAIYGTGDLQPGVSGAAPDGAGGAAPLFVVRLPVPLPVVDGREIRL